ncbi:MAG TPA: DUF4870 domain-containing protein [Leptolyngbyaceae cyanobacterium M33_DOE_097]|uniref:DUF4870 domain-containing protein n=1 Tax=Oscillatoriales cyanobacterium SpSt-418 TaxID=2282169 RepID=A0A7C3PLD3_9CYAN|nr:DUF4870 domain-containing protein [Leptolyngbyaceae cyanobacterium M33_DOE_097]
MMRDSLPSPVRQWGMWCHLSSLAWIVVPVRFISLVVPLIIWLLKREEHPFIDAQGKESLNFQISIVIYEIAITALWAVAGIFLFGSAFFAAPALESSDAAGIAFVASLGIVFLVPVILLMLIGVFAAIAAIVAALKASNGESYRYPFTLRFLK